MNQEICGLEIRSCRGGSPAASVNLIPWLEGFTFSEVVVCSVGFIKSESGCGRGYIRLSAAGAFTRWWISVG